MLIYKKDSFNRDLLFDDSINYQTMMEWEKPYMEALVNNLNPTGDVLEIGFGLGFSATQIQKYNIKSHTIIEMDDTVCEKLEKWSYYQPHKVNIVKGSWQETLQTLGEFDSIFLDDAPNSIYPDKHGVTNFVFYYEVAKNHVRENSKMTWYCGEPIYWITNSFVDFICKDYKIDIPQNCDYINEQTKDKKILYMPTIFFRKGKIVDIKPFGIDRNSQIVNIDINNIWGSK